MINRHYNLAAGLLFVFTWGVGASAYAQTLTAPADQIYVQGEMIIPPFSLPEVTGGTSTYTYSLNPIPHGLMFDGSASARTLSGIPTTRGTTTLTYSATDIVTGMVVDDDTFIVTVVPMATVELLPPSNGDFIAEGGASTSRHITVKLELADGALELGREVVIPVSLSSTNGATPFLDYSVRVNNILQTFTDENNPSQMVMVTFAADTTIDPNTMTFLSQIIEIRVKNDMAFEAIESVRFSVGNLSGLKGVTAGVANSQMVTINILSNDGDLGIGAFDMATGGNSVLGTTPPSMFTTTEGGTNTFYVQLFSQPEATVTVMVTSTNTDEGIITSGDSLTFTSMNWSMRQPVIVTGVDDNVVDGNIPYLINLTPATDDPIYSLPVLTVFIRPINNDNDAVSTINLSVFPTIVDEAAGLTTVNVTATLGDGTVVLTTPTTVTVSVGSPTDTATEATDYNASSDFTLTIPAFTTIATGQFTIAPVVDGTTEGEEMVTIGGTATGLTVIPATLTLSDVGILVYDGPLGSNDISTAEINENGGTDTLWVQLASQPADDVTVMVTSDDTNEGTITSGASLTFTSMNWVTRQPVTITAVDDNITRDGDSFTVNFMITDGDGADYTNSLTLPSVVVTVIDDESMTTLSIADMRVNENAGIATVTVMLSTMVTTGDVMVNATTMDGTAEAGTDYTAITNQLVTFAAGSTSETLDITINNDDIDENDETFTVMLDNLVTPPGVTMVNTINTTATVTITDDDSAGFEFFDADSAGNPVTTLTTSEDATTATFYVQLTSQPTATVTVMVTSTNPAEGIITTGDSLTFTTMNWFTRQQVTVTGVNDDLTDGDQTYDLTLSASDGGYDGVMQTLSVTNTDNDIAALTIVDGGGVSTSEDATTDSFTVALALEPTATVTVTIGGLDTGEHSLTPSTTLTFTTSEWATAQTITLTGVNDDLTDGNQTYDLTLSASDGGYDGVMQTLSVTNTDNDIAALTIVDGGGVSTSEDATTDSFTVALALEPTATVTVTIGGLDTGEHSLTPSTTLTFTTSEWATAQTITLTGVNDDLTDGNQTYDLTLSASDGGYDGVMQTLSVTNTDNDIAALTIVDGGGVSTSEDATTDSFTVALALEPTATVTVTIGGLDTGEHSLTPSTTLTFTTSEWATAQTITLTGVNDDLTDGNQTYDLTLSASDGGYDGVMQTLSVTNTDNDIAALTIVDGGGVSTSEDATTDSFTVALALEPTATVTVTIGGLDTGEHSLTPSTTLTFTTSEWATAQTITLTGVNDDLTDGNQTYDLTLSASDGGYDGVMQTLSVTNTDNDIAALTIVDGGGVSTSEDATTDSFTVALALEPTATVTVTIGGLDTGEHSLTPSTTLTFTTSEWATAQTITLTGVNDDLTDGNQTYDLTLSASDGGYDGVMQTLSVTNTDNDIAALTIVDGGGVSTSEDATTDSFTVALALEPTATVTVTIGGLDTGEHSLTPSTTLTFTTSEWATAQTITLTGVNDDLTDGNQTYDLTLSASDGGYDGVMQTLSVTNTDNDIAALTIVDGGGVSTSEDATTDSFTVALALEPTATVTVTIGGLDTGEHSLTPSTTLTFTTSEWATAQTITLTGVNDDLTDGNQTYDLTLSASDGGYDGVMQTLSVTNTDNDIAALTIVDGGGVSTSEDATTDSFTVALALEPTATVTVTIGGLDTGEHSLTPSTTLTFTTSEWATAQTITLTGVNDDLTDGNQTYDLTLSASDGGYDGVMQTLSVTNTDNDIAALTIVDGGGVSTSEDATTDSFTVALALEPTATVTVTIGGLDTGEHSLTPSTTLTFTTSEWATAQTITLTGVNDDLTDGNQTYDLTLSASDGGYDGVMQTLSVTNTDNDIAALTIVDGGGVSTSEDATTDSFTVALALEPTATVTVTIGGLDTGEHSLTPSTTLTFTTSEWATAQTITLTGVNDDLTDGNQTYDLTLSASDGGYDGVMQTLSVTNTDNDIAALTIVDGGGVSTSEDATTDSFTVALALEPTATVTVTIGGLDTGEHSLTPSTTLTFTTSEWATAQTITLTGVNDDLTDGNQTYDLTLSASDGGYDGVMQTLSVTNTDNDIAALTIVDGGGVSTSEDATTDSFTVALALEPTATVTVTIGGLDTGEHSLTPSTTLTFTTSEWATAQTITLTGVNDDLTDGNQTYDLTLSASDGGYDGVMQTLSVTNTDNDIAALTIVDGGGVSTSEDATTDSFTVALALEPTATVTVTIGGLDTGEHSLTPSTTLTFTTSEWATAQTITLTGVNDDLTDGNQTYDLTLSASDGGYDGVMQTLSVTNTDNDIAALTIVDGGGVSTSEDATTDSFTVALALEPTATVTVTIGGLDTGEHSLTPSTTLTFTTSEWATAQTITLTGVNDDLTDGNQTYDLTLSASDGGYDGVMQTLSVTNTDNDIAALTIVDGGGVSTSEDATTDSFTVALALEPTATVTVTIGGLDTGEHSLTPSTTLTFTTSEWATAQTITLTGVNDDLTDGNQTYDLTLSASDGGYDGVMQTLSVTNTDNDIAALTIVDGGGVSTSEDATTDSFTVALALEPTATVTVTIGGLDTGEHSLTPSTTLTFTTSEWATAQTITLTGVNDDLTDGNQTYDLTLSASDGGYDGVMQTLSVTNTDNDIAALTIVDGGGVSTSEDATTDSFTVALALEPTATVTVTIGGLDTGEHSLTPSTTLTFTTSEWATAQTITLTGVNDDLTDGNQTYDLTLSASDGGYDGVMQTLSVTNTDNDIAALTIVDGGGVSTSEDATTDSFTVALALEPTATVTVTIGGLDTGEHSLTPSTTLTFTTSEWATAQTITLTGVNDDLTDGNQTYDLTLSASDGGYDGVMQTLSVTNTDNDIAALTIVDGGGVSTSEDATTDSFTVALALEPTATVTVTIGGLDTGEHSLTPSTTLTFTTSEWATAQTITLTGVNDDLTDGNQTYDLTLSASDGGYDGVTQTLSVTNTDNDIAALTIVDGGGVSTSEDATTDSFTVALALEPTATVTVTIGGLDTGEHSLTPSTTLTFTTSEWATAQTITLTGVNDDLTDGNQTYDLTLSASDGGYDGVTQTLSVTNTDNDIAALTIVDGGGVSTSEDATTDSFTVALALEPTATVTVTIGGLDTGEHSLTPSTTLTFTTSEWATAQTITLTGVNDDLTDGNQTYDLTLSASDGGYDGVTQTLSVTNTDNDIAALTIVDGGGVSTSEDATTDSFTVALALEPTATVTVTIGGLDTGEHSLTPSTTLTFTTSEWATAQTITLTGVNDDLTDGNQTYDLTLSASDGGYDGVTQTLSVTNTDNDIAALTIVDGGGVSTSEDATTDSFTVALALEPTATVTVTIGGLDTGEHSLTPSTTLTFTTSEWATAQTITLTGVNDDLTDGNQTYDLTLSASDGGYDGVTQTLSVTNTDNDIAALTIVDGGGVSTSEDATTDSFTVALALEPTATVTVTIGGLDTGEHSLTPSTTLTFTTSEWATAQTITLTGVNDDLTDGNQTYDLTLSASDGGYDGVTQTLSVTNTDNDIAALTIVDGGGVSTSEDATTDSFTVALALEPTATVTVTIGGLDTGEHSLTPSTTLTFTTSEWATAQTITLTGVNDDLTDGNQTYDLTLSASDGGYDGVTQTLSVTNTDNDIAALTIVDGGGVSTSEDATTDSFTVALALEPTATVTVTIGGLDTGEHSLTPSTTLTFTTSEWATAQTITLTGVNDDLTDGNQTYDLTLSASDGGYDGVTQTLSVTNTDNDIAALTIVDGGGVSTSEDATTDSFTVALALEPTATVTVTIGGLDTGEHSLTPSTTLTFTTSEWATAQTITLTGVNDDLTDGNQTYDLTLSASDGGYDGVMQTLSVTNTDNDIAALTIVDGGGVSTSEDATTDSFTVALALEPTATVTVTIGGLDTGEHSLTPSTTLTFTTSEWATAQTITLTGVNDDLTDGNQTYDLTLSASDGGYDGVMQTLSVTNTDNDIAALTIVDGGGVSTSEDATTDSFTVALALEPTATVTVTIGGLDTGEHSLTPSTTLTFTTSEWATAQTITLTGVNDDLTDGNQTYDLTLSASDGGYDGVTQTLSVTNTDNDIAALTIVDGGGVSTSEDATTDSFTVALALEPTATVTVTIGGLDTGEHSLTPSTTLTFTTSEWATAQTITLTGVNDDLTDGNQTYDLTLSASDGGYDGVMQTLSVTNTDNDIAALTIVDGGGVSTSEDATTDSFTVALALEPTATVTVTIGGLDTGEHSLTPSTTLTFTTSEWATAQTITLTGVNDDLTDGNQTYDLTLSASDGGYDGVMQTLSVTNTDNDIAALTIVDGGGVSTSEDATTDSFTVALALEPTATVTVTIGGLDTGEHSLTPSTTLTFTTSEWATAQTITLTGVNDDLTDGNQTYDLTLSASDGGYDGVMQTLSVTNTDNDIAALTIVDGGGVSTSEDATTDSFTVALALEPTATVTVTIGGLDTGEHSLTPSTTLTFTTSEWATAQTITLTGVNDDLTDGNQTYDLTLSASDGGYDGVMQTLSVTNTDNDIAALTIVDGGGVSTSEDATTDSFTVALALEPTATVTVTIGGLDTGEHSLTPSTTLTFTTSEWATAQTITLTGVNDDLTDGNQTYDLTLSASDGGYDGVMQTLSVTNTDNDIAALTIVDGGGVSTSEDATTDSFTVALALEPTATVTVTIGGLDTGEHSLTPSTTLTFTTSEWATAQTITLTGVNDDLTDGNQTYDLTLSASDGGYDGVMQTLSVTNTDNDIAALTIVDGGGVSTSEDATTDSFTVALALEPTATVTVTIGGLDTGEHSLTPSTTLTFTTSEWATAQTITLTGVNDDLTDGNQTYDLTLSASDGGYDGVMQTLSVTNTDNDIAALTIVDGGGVSTSEDATTDSFTVALALEPTATVTVTIGGLDTGEHSLTPSTTLTFTTSEWATAQTITLTGVNDDLTDGNQTYDLTLSASDGGYDGVMQTLSVTNTDNDIAALTIVDGGGVSTSEDATTDSFTVALALEPTATVTVTIGGLDTGEHSLTPSTTLTFTTSEWATAQTITLTGVNDDLTDGNQTYDLTLSASDGGYDGVTQTLSVTNTDNESMTTLSIADTSVNENAGIATVTVTLSNGVTAGDVTVDLTTMDGTAEAGEDYTAFTSETLTFAAGSTSETLNIPINNDNVNENDETFTVMLSNLLLPTGVTAVSISNATATVTIIDDDTDSTTINLSVSPSTVAETAGATDITVTATLDGAASTMATDVVVTVGGGTATSGTDYTATPATLTITIPALATSGNGVFSMTPIADDESDTDETITISGMAGSFTVNSATLTIIEGLNTEQRDTLHRDLLSVANQATMQVMVDVLSKRLTPRARTEAHGSVAGHVLGLQEMQAVDWQKRLSLAVYSTLQRLDEGGALLVPVDATTFDNSEFVLPLPVGESAVVLWGAFGSSTVEGGQSDAHDYDGDVIAVLLGIDSMIGEHARLGIAASYEHSELDYQLDMTSGDAVQTMTSIQPYLSWQPHDSVGLWLLGGYGFGDYDATESTAGGTTLRVDNADTERWMAAMGLHYTHRFGDSGWDMVLHNKALWNRTVRDAARFDDGSLLPRNVSENWRTRLESEVGYSWTFGDGSVRPYGLASVRWDGGDVVNDDTTFMVDAGGGVELSFASRLSMDFKVRRQVTDGDHEEHSVVAVGSFGFAEHADGQGWQVALERSLLGGLSAPEHNKAGFDFEQGDSTPTIGQSPSLQANVGYGRLINPLTDAKAGLLKTYTRFYLDPDENKRHAVGLGFDFTSLQVGVESEYNNGELETLLWGHIDF